MHFHVPQPLHGWRAFVGEVGIIVIGVLIALGAEQLVSDWHWRQEVVDSDRRISDELRLDLVNADERLAITGCLEPRLAELRDQLVKAHPDWPGTRARLANDLYRSGFPPVYRTPDRPWFVDAWQTAVNGEILSHFNPDRVAKLSSLFESVAKLKRDQDEEAGIAASLGDLAFAGPISSSDRRANLKLVARLDALNSRILFESRLMLSDARKAGLAPDPEELKDSLDQQRAYRGGCVRPLA